MQETHRGVLPIPTRREQSGRRGTNVASRPQRRKHAKRTRRCSSSQTANLLTCLIAREVNSSNAALAQSRLARFAERKSVELCADTQREVDLPSDAKCTIAVTCSSGHTVISTHGGDHTVKVSEYMTGKVLHSLPRHQRTPWAVAVDEYNPRLMASGCLSGTVCIWLDNRLYKETNLADDLESRIIMSLAFHRSRDGNSNVVLIAMEKAVFVWDFENTGRAIPWERRERRIQTIHFAGQMMITAEQIERGFGSLIVAWDCPEQQGDLFFGNANEITPNNGRIQPRVVLSNAILYSDGGISISSCNQLLLAIHSNAPDSSVTSRCELVMVSLHKARFGQVVRSIELSHKQSAGLTSVKFSPTNEHIVCGYGVDKRHPINEHSQHKYCLAFFSNYQEDGDSLKLLLLLTSSTDDVNVALFHPNPGYGVLYATRQGPLRILGDI